MRFNVNKALLLSCSLAGQVLNSAEKNLCSVSTSTKQRQNTSEAVRRFYSMMEMFQTPQSALYVHCTMCLQWPDPCLKLRRTSKMLMKEYPNNCLLKTVAEANYVQILRGLFFSGKYFIATM